MADPQREFVISGEALSSRCRLNDMGQHLRGSSGIGELGRTRRTRRKVFGLPRLTRTRADALPVHDVPVLNDPAALPLGQDPKKTVKILQKLDPSLQCISNFLNKRLFQPLATTT